MLDDEINARLASIRHVALDMDGTIYKGQTLFGFTHAFLACMRNLGIGVTFLTNNSSKSTKDYAEHLARVGLGVQPDQIVTAGRVTIEYLQTQYPEHSRLFILGTESLREEFSQSGFTVVSGDETDQPDAVVIGFDTGLAYPRLCSAAYWINRGIPFIATHPDLVCPTDQQTVLVDCGAICSCLTAATGRSPDIVLGKPHPSMLAGILSRHDLEPQQLAMVGDRLSTDIAMAHASGALGVLVLTGEATVQDTENCAMPPDLVLDDLGELGRIMDAQARRCERRSSAVKPGIQGMDL
ncbi:MAG: HAD-IIA family hydrolase [Planctomycetales bacterium]|nr:HAD-IIA family hydrolase [Planctomycetales bacterium]